MRKIYIIFNLLVFILCYFLVKDVNSLEFRCIYIDPGHGGIDGGAYNDDILEKDLNLEVSLKLRDIFVKEGYNVILTRDKDCSLGNNKKSDLIERANMINESNALLFISIHMNKYSDSKYKGAQVFYSNVNEMNKSAAYLIQERIKKNLKNTTRNEKEIKGIYLLDNVKTPGVLVECGFLSNYEERINLCNPNYQGVLARCIYLGCRDFLIKYQ